MAYSLYFAYGSNMPSAQVINTARLDGHQLAFHKASVDNSGKCDIEHTQNGAHFVLGVPFKLPLSEKKRLDSIEGVGQGYEQKTVLYR